MPGITTRSNATLTIEAVRAIFANDANVTADFEGGVTVGPFAPDPQSGIVTITPRMINLMVGPNLGFEPGVSGVADVIVPIVVLMFDFFGTESYTTGSPNVTPWDRREYLERLLANGTEADGSGKLVNPDDPTNPSTKIKYLNVEAPVFETLWMGKPVHISETQQNVARLYAFRAIYGTKLLNITRARG